MPDLNYDEVTLLAIKGAISELESEKRQELEEMACQIRSMVKRAGSAGVLVIALLGAELRMETNE